MHNDEHDINGNIEEQSTLPANREETIHPFTQANLSTLNGRMNRLDFIILMCSISLLLAILYKFMGINPISISAQAVLDPESTPDGLNTTILLGTLSIIAFALLSVKRFHDIDYSGWVASVFVLPILFSGALTLLAAFVGFILRLILMFAPGVPKANKYGGLSVGNNRKKILILLLIIFLLFNLYGSLIDEASPYLEQLRQHMLDQQSL